MCGLRSVREVCSGDGLELSEMIGGVWDKIGLVFCLFCFVCWWVVGGFYLCAGALGGCQRGVFLCF